MSQNVSAWWGFSLVRTILGWIDWAFFQILGWVYEVFYAIANAELFSGETVYNFIGRVQLILGIFMVFKLTIMILKSMVNPDLINDKNAGYSSIITRIVTSLVMLSLIMPLNIPTPKNSFETELNNNGIMFGTLYSLQKRVLQNDVLGQLILGNDQPRRSADGSVQANRLPGIKEKFISTIVKGFVRRNLKDEDDPNSLMCDVEITKDNNYENASTTELLMDHLNDDCDGSGLFEKKYALAYVPIVGSIVAIIFTILFASFSIDIAIRSVKLSVLRLIAPIPIMSYIEPEQAKKGAFANWVKLLTATYLDLFIRLAMVYFALFLIEDIVKNGLVMNESMGVSGITGVVAFIVICIGLLMFAKMAPKFITDALGIQSHMSNVGLSAVLGGTAMALGGGGARGFAYGAMNGINSSLDGEATGKPAPIGAVWSQNRDLMAKIRTGDKDAHGGFMGAQLDKLNYQAREAQAEKYGISATDVAKAKYEADQWEAESFRTKKALDFATQKYNTLGPNATQAERDAAYAEYQRAYEENEKVAAKFAKASKTYEKMDKARAQMGVAPRMVDTREETYRTPYKVTKAKETDRLLLDKDNNVVRDENGDPIYQIDYTYKKDTNSFTGTLDDSFGSGSMGTGAPGGNGGGPTPPPGK